MDFATQKLSEETQRYVSTATDLNGKLGFQTPA
jgi:hypothetical protein